MARTWVGVKKLAVVPTFNTQFDPPPPDNWNELVRRRVFYDPDPATGIDRSLRAYIEFDLIWPGDFRGPPFSVRVCRRFRRL